jgi:hypothetical protein
MSTNASAGRKAADERLVASEAPVSSRSGLHEPVKTIPHVPELPNALLASYERDPEVELTRLTVFDLAVLSV